MVNEKEIKKVLFQLRKCKRKTKVKSPERREINKRIRELKQKIQYDIPDTEKQSLIEEIYKIRPEYKELKINLLKFSTEQLKKHLKLIKRKESK